MLHEWAADVDWGSEGRRWSHSRDLGGVRIVMLDSREGRVLGERPRRMFDDEEWGELVGRDLATSGASMVADTLPIFLPQAIHSLELGTTPSRRRAWSPLMKFSERARRSLDLEHWGAFPHSFERIVELMGSTGAGERGAPHLRSSPSVATSTTPTWRGSPIPRRGAS